MLNVNLTKYTYKDVAIMPATISEISSRKECIPFDSEGYYPLFTAPMTSVVDMASSKIFENNKIHSIIPRSIDFDTRLVHGRLTKRWIAVSLKEFSETFLVYNEANIGMKVLIDVANGHMKVLYETVKAVKNIYGNQLTVMVGNIANPKTYIYAINAGVDAIRCGIGAGCFVKGSKVTTQDGVKAIEDIKQGDKVLTHTNTFKSVVSTMVKKYNGDILNVNGTKCTPNHEFYVIYKKDAPNVTDDNYQKYAFWVEAQNLTEDMLLVSL